ncbi:UNVERIFIED_ORG: putative membrane protein YcfT [Arthrobacter globiformis]|nr:putative membrane protein YcfT [Arthrobacter globiformis]
MIIFHADVHAYPGDLNAPLPIALLNVSLEPLRMPLLVFLSGTLVPRSLAKGKKAYLGGKMRGVLYPYLVWTVILVAVTWLVQSLDGRSIQWDLVARAIVNPLGHMWFLAYLLVFYVIAWATRRVNPALIGAASLSVPLIPAIAAIGYRPFAMLGFFMLGVATASTLKETFEALMNSRLLGFVGPLGLAGIMLISSSLWLAGTPVNPSDVRLAPFTLLFILWIMKLFKNMPSLGTSSLLGSIGRQSLVYYVTHWPVMMLVGIALSTFPAILAFVLMIAAALAIGLLIATAKQRWSAVGALYAAPRR